MSTSTGQHAFLKTYQSDWSARPVLNDVEIRQLETDVSATLSDASMAFVLNDSIKCRIAMQLLAVLPTVTGEAQACARRTLAALQASSMSAGGASGIAPWCALIAEVIGTQSPWISPVAPTAATAAASSSSSSSASSSSPSGAAATPETSARATRVETQLLPRLRGGISAVGKPPADVTTRRGRGALYQYTDCDDLPPCAELADPDLLGEFVPDAAVARKHFERTGEFLASLEVDRQFWKQQEDRATAHMRKLEGGSVGPLASGGSGGGIGTIGSGAAGTSASMYSGVHGAH